MRLVHLTNPYHVWSRREHIPKGLAEVARQAVRRVGIPISSDDRRIRKLKGLHCAHRAFIVGNGPSLRISDLDRLRGEITFASNKIYLAFDQTPWRPTYYSVVDRLVAKNNAETIRRLQLCKLLSDDIRQFFPTDTDAIWLHELWRNSVIGDLADGRTSKAQGYFSRDLMVGVDAGWTVIYTQLQIAYYMGIREVYLLGVDFDFTLPAKRTKTQETGYETVLEAAGEANHFHPQYRQPGELWAIPRLDCQEHAFRLAREQYENVGRPIWNASRKSKLAVFPRVDFDSVVPSASQQCLGVHGLPLSRSC